MILAGDIGGTKCTLALYDVSGDDLVQRCRLTLPTRSSASVEEILDQFNSFARQQGIDVSRVTACAGFGVAGTVVGDHVLSGNMPWPVERNTIAAALKIDSSKVALLND